MPVKVLLVDDETDTLRLLAALLGRHGFDTSIALNGFHALEVAAAYLPDVVCLDLGMPKMNGYEAARRLRELDGLAQVSIIAVSGYPADTKLLEAASIDRHLLKPVSSNSLFDAICEMVPEKKTPCDKEQSAVS